MPKKEKQHKQYNVSDEDMSRGYTTEERLGSLLPQLGAAILHPLKTPWSKKKKKDDMLQKSH